jgi:hypothetical protein
MYPKNAQTLMITYIRDYKGFIADCRFARRLFPYAGYDLERRYHYSSCDGDTGQQE